MSKLHIKKDDQVYVLTGKDRAKTGRVIAAFPKKGTVIVEDVNVVTKHQKPSRQFQQGGITHMEAPINASNVMLVCPKCNKPAKTGTRIQESGKRVRYCKRCDAELRTLGPDKK